MTGQVTVTFRRSDGITLAIAAAIIFYQIILPPAVGLADNGDAAKIIAKFGLGAPVDDPDDASFRYIHLRYGFSRAYRWNSGFRSSETLLFLAAVGLNVLVSKDGGFDLRVMGAVHAAIFLESFALLLPLFHRAGAVCRTILLALAVLIFCDPAYVACYNSFYMATGSFVFLLATIALLLRAVYLPERCPRNAWFAWFSCLLFIAAKSQHAPLGLPLAVFFVWKRNALWPRRAGLASAFAAVSITAGVAYALVLATPRAYTAPSVFNVIFWGLLPSAKDPRAELGALGLDESYLRYRGLHAFAPGSPMSNESFVREFLHKTSYARLAGFYAAHPRRALKMLKRGLEEASWQRAPNLGNFDKSAGYPPFFQSSAFSLWSAAKNRFFRIRAWEYLLVFAIAVSLVSWRFPAGGLALAAMGLIAFAVGALADAAETARHLFLFNAIWDVSFFAALCALMVASRRISFVRR